MITFSVTVTVFFKYLTKSLIRLHNFILQIKNFIV